MKKLKLILLLLFGACITGAHGQQASVAAGGDATGSGGSVSYTVGQVSYLSLSGSNGSLNEGVQQPYEFFTGISENTGIQLSMTVYPNPTNAQVYLIIEDVSLDQLQYRMYDAAGKLVIQSAIVSTQTELSTQSLAPGTYYLSVEDQKEVLQNFTIIKNN